MLSGNCSGMGSMLSDLPETEINLLTHQPPDSAHSSAVTIQSVTIYACLEIEEANSLFAMK